MKNLYPTTSQATSATATHLLPANLLRLPALKLLLLFALLLGVRSVGWGQVLLTEDFNYSLGTVLTATATADPTTGWLGHSGNGTANIDVTNGLSFTDFAGSGIGGAANLDNNGQDINKTFTSQTSGVIYASLMIKTLASNSAGYFFMFSPNPIATTFYSRVYVNATGSGVGISGSSVPGSYISITAGSTVLLVVKYNFTTQVSSLFVLNTFSSTEPGSADQTYADLTATSIGAVALRQYNASQRIIVDGIRVGTTWAGVMPSASKTVTFNSNGGTGTMANQISSAAANLNTNTFTRTGYTFNGWNTIALGGGTAYTDGQSYSFAADLTLYAQWTPNNNTITFDGNGNTGGSTTSQIIATAASANLTANGFIKTGYTFAGWATTAGGAVAFVNQASYTMGTGDVTLYAKWTANNNTIAFDGNGADGGSTEAQTIATDATAALTANGFTLTGYTFAGWATTAGGVVAYADGESYTMGTSDVTLYAIWNEITSPVATITGPLAEASLNGYALNLTLSNETFNTLTPSTSDFILNNAPIGLTIGSLTYNSTTNVTLNLAYSGDFDANVTNFNITVSGSIVTGAADVASNNITLTALVESITPGTVTAFGTQTVNTTSGEKSFTVSATARATVSLTPPSGYEISTGTGGSFVAENPINLTPTGTTLSSTTIYVRFTPTAITTYSNPITASSTYATDVTVALSGSGIAPLNPATFTATTASSTQINLAASANANGNNIVVVYNGTGTFNTPTDGLTAGVQGDAFAGGTIWYIGSAASLTNHTGLSPSQTVYYKAFSFDAANFYSSGSTANATTVKAEPDAQPTTLVFSTITTSSFNTAFTAASGSPDGYIVISSTGSSLSADPVDGTTYTAGNSLGGGAVVSVGSTITGIANSGLSAGTTYYTFVYAYNNSGALINYNTTSPLSSSTITLCAAPAPSATNTTSVSFDINWSGVTGASSYQLDVTTDAGFTTPVSGFNGINATSPTSVTGLAANTTYYFRVSAVNASGNSAYGTGSQLTLGLVPPVAAAADPISTTSFTANWGAVSGATDYKLDVATTSSFEKLTTPSNENFESNSLSNWSNTGSWLISNISAITGTYSLRSNASPSAQSTSYITTQPGSFDVTTSSTTWRFNIKTNYSPSGNNHAHVVLMSNQSNLTLANGYVVGFNFSGTDDFIKLWRCASGSSAATILTSTQKVVSGTIYGIEVIRSSTGEWTLSYKVNGGFASMTLVGTATDATYTNSTYTGLVSYTSSSNYQNLRFDDFSIANTSSSALSSYNNLSVGNEISKNVNIGISPSTPYYYRVRAYSASSTSANSTPTITVTTHSNPTPFAMTGSGAYCAGGSGVEVGLAGSQPGVNYTLIKGGSPTATVVPGTGSPISFGNQLFGAYTASGEADGSVSTIEGTTAMTGSASVTENPLPTPTFTLQPGANSCVSSDVTYTTEASKSSYVWTYPGSTLNTDYTITSGGTSTDNTVTLKWLTTGAKTVGVNYSTSGCTAASATESNATTVNALPTAYNVAGGGSYCIGGTGRFVGLEDSDLGINYELYADGITTGEVVAGTGTNIAFATPQTAVRTYTVVAKNTTTNCTQNMTGSVTISTNPLPAAAIALSGPTTFCAGGSVTLTASGGTSYSWSSSQTVAAITVSVGGTYSVLVTDANGCEAVAASPQVIVNPLPVAPTSVVSSNDNYCQSSTGEYITLTSTGGLGDSQKWFTGSCGGTLYGTGNYGIPIPAPAVTTTYYTYWENGCGISACANVTITVKPLPSAPTVSTPIQYCSNAAATPLTATGSNLLWYAAETGGTGSSTAPTPSTTTAGSTIYWVSQTNGSGCESSRLAIVVTVNAAPTAPTIGTITQPTCSTATGSVELSGLPVGNWTINPGNVTGSTATKTITDLTAATYNYTVTNSDGCTSEPSLDVVINAAPETPTAPTIGTITQPTCSTATGSFQITGYDAANTYNFTPAVVSISGIGLVTANANTYTFTLTNAAGCTSAPSANVDIDASPIPVANAGPPTGWAAVGKDYTFPTAVATGGVISWTVSGSGAGTFINENTEHPVFHPTGSGQKTFTLTVTSATCELVATDVIVLTMLGDPYIWSGNAEIGSKTDWNNEGNWFPPDAGAPTSINDVLISVAPNYPILKAAAECKNIVIESGASFIDEGHFLTITTGGTATVYHPAISAGQWHLISSPVAGAVSALFTDQYLKKYVPASGYVTISDLATNLNAMEGYSLWPDGSAFTAPYVGSNLNSGNIDYTLVAPPTAKYGWNLVGNPYPSTIDWDLVDTTHVTGSIYIENGASWSSYVKQVGTNGGSRYIAPTQGFFIKAKSGGGIFSLTPAVQLHHSSTFRKSAEEAVPNLVRLQVSGNGYKDEAVVRFVPEASSEFDGSWDASKFFGTVPAAAQLYTLGSTALSINSMPETESVAVGIKIGVSGSYTLAATELNDLSYAYLEDIEKGVFTPLSGGSYTFSAEAGTYEQRFRLHFSLTSVEEAKKVTSIVYSYQRTVHINMKDQQKGDIFIYNIAGQLVKTLPSASGDNQVLLPVTGNYIVKVVSKDKTTVRKVWIE